MPLVGYRAWGMTRDGDLRSVYRHHGDRWVPYEAHRAVCRTAMCGSPAFGRNMSSPAVDCSCGVYAFKACGKLLDELRRRDVVRFMFANDLSLVVGEVKLWGHVVEHNDGWRAEFAYPASLSNERAAHRYGVEALRQSQTSFGDFWSGQTESWRRW